MSLQPLVIDDPRQVFDRVPFIGLLGMQRVHAEAGRARLQLAARPDLGNVIGAVHGGAVLTLLDVVMASAAVSRRDFSHTAVTLAMSSSFVAPGRGLLTADGRCLHEADDVAFCEARVTDADGSLVAQAQGSFRYLPLPGVGAPPASASLPASAAPSAPTAPPTTTPPATP